MSLPPQKMREVVFQLLFSSETGQIDAKDSVVFISKELAISKKYVLQALEKAYKIIEKKDLIDAEIRLISESYTLERIQLVEINILRVGIYELLFDKEIPPKVAISEGMRLARKFSTSESAAYINAVLDAIYKRSQGLTADLAMVQLKAKEMKEMEEIAIEASQNQPIKQEEEEIDF